MASIEIQLATTPRDRRALVTFPWRIYRDDPHWVPPLISERLEYLDPARGPFYEHAEVALFLARRDGKLVGTVGACVDRRLVEQTGQAEGGFGFFESVDDDAVAARLLDAACAWLRARGMQRVVGPASFTDNDYPGVLVEPTDCPPAMLEAHTPLYYQGLLERYGLRKSHDLYAWRASREQIGDGLANIPPSLLRVAEVARTMANVTIRRACLEAWDEEVATIQRLHWATLPNIFQRATLTEPEFRRLAGQIRPFLDPDLALIAEVEGEPVGFLIAMPDINRALIQVNGRLFPLGWLKLQRAMRRVDVVTFKMVGVLEEYRRRGIDALLYLEAVRAVYDKGYAWLDGSVSSEQNPMINRIAERLGAELYKHYRMYELEL